MRDDLKNKYLRRNLNVTEAFGIRSLGCVRCPDIEGSMGVRMFFATGTDRDLFATCPEHAHAQLVEIRSINNGLIIEAKAPVGAAASLQLKSGEALSLKAEKDEAQLFDGLNVILAERNGEPVEVIEDWLRYHVMRFGVQGVLLLDREKRQNNELEGELKALSDTLGLSRLVHLKSPVSLGDPELPSASHPFCAPDAPGKDRMADLSPDPWTSPLREATLFDLVRWRFLQGARAVMNLDLTDLLQPGTDPFATVQDSSTGVLQMVGQRIYPWRVRKGATPSFGDHICRQFDSAQPNRRWCVAPARLSPDQVWRYVRVSNTTPAEEEIVPFWRAMAIRHHDSAPSQIVPKTSLIEDPALVKLARTAFRHKPVFPPSSKIKDQPAQPGETGRTCIVTTMKNEGPFILEWIAYHRAIGVEDFLVYTNDCTDGTDDLLDLLQAKGLVQHRDNPFRQTGLKPQHAALQAAEEEEILQKAGWAICMDVDEYINIHCGEGRLKDLFDRIGDANMISLTWRLFGNDDVHEFRDGFIIEQFNRCAPELCRKPHQAWGFKTLFRNIGIYKKMGVHRPKGLKPDLWDQITWVNGSGEPMPRSLLRNGWRSTTESYGYELVTLNHYAVRSAESFLVKRDRGRVNHVDRDQGLGYWFRMNNNWQKDRSIHGKLPLLREEFDRLMADPEIRAAHEFCVLRHRAKIDELRDSPAYAAFYKELTSPRMERLSRLHTHFGANVFLAGPSAIPDEVANLKAIAPDFFFTVERAETNH